METLTFILAIVAIALAAAALGIAVYALSVRQE